MAKQLLIYGASDNLVEMRGVHPPGEGEFSVYSKPDAPTLTATFLVTAGGYRMHVYAIYDGCWCFGLGQAEQDDPMPPWPILRAWSGYTETVYINLPDDATVVRIYDDDKDD